MKLKTSISLTRDVLTAIDRLAKRPGGRSAVIERCLREYLHGLERERIGRRDLELINAHAAELNAEMADVLSYQTWPHERNAS